MEISNLRREMGREVSLLEQQFNVEFYLWLSNMGVVIIILALQHKLIFSFSSTLLCLAFISFPVAVSFFFF